MKLNPFLKEIKSKVLQEDEDAFLILYGSRARGDNQVNSDWDILILTSKKRTIELENKLRDSIYSVELDHLQPASIIILNKEEWSGMEITPFHRNVTTEGKTI